MWGNGLEADLYTKLIETWLFPHLDGSKRDLSGFLSEKKTVRVYQQQAKVDGRYSWCATYAGIM
jgi:hypothetical protein